MAITAFDANTALIVIDLQKGILAYPTIQPAAEIVAQVCVLIDGFRRHALPIVFVNVTGGAPGRTQQERSSTRASVDAADLLPELKRQPEDHLVTKRTAIALRVYFHGWVKPAPRRKLSIFSITCSRDSALTPCPSPAERGEKIVNQSFLEKS